MHDRRSCGKLRRIAVRFVPLPGPSAMNLVDGDDQPGRGGANRPTDSKESTLPYNKVTLRKWLEIIQ